MHYRLDGLLVNHASCLRFRPPPPKQYELLIDTLASFFEARKLSSQFIEIAWKNTVAERAQRASTSEDTRK